MGRVHKGMVDEVGKGLDTGVPSIRRKSNLARIPRDRVPGKPLLPILTEIIRVVDQDLIIK